MAAKRKTVAPSKTSPHPALEDLEAFEALAPAGRRALAQAIAAELGENFRAGDGLVGDAELASVVHLPSALELVLIPGGVFQMGFAEADRRSLEHFFPRDAHPGLHAAVKRTEPSMTPTREVRVRPFALARRPLEQEQEQVLFTGEPHGEGFSRDQAEAVVAAWGFRFPSEAECEYVAREGRQLSFLLDVAAEHFEGTDGRDETAWGIADPGQTVWVGDRWHRGYTNAPRDGSAWTSGTGLPMHRGSFSLGLSDMVRADELVFALTALRQEPLGEDDERDVRLRFALGPDEAGRWRAAPSTSTRPLTNSPRVKAKAAAQATPEKEAQPKPPARAVSLEALGADWMAEVLAEPDEARAGELAVAALRAHGFSAPGGCPPLPSELSTELREALGKLFESRPALPLPTLPLPTDPAVRRRWLGLSPPGDLETVVTFRLRKKEQTAPFWRAAFDLGEAGETDDVLALLSPAAAVRACVEIALTGGYHDHRPEPTWPLLASAGAENSAWARATLERIEAAPPTPGLRSMLAYALVYPIAAAGLPVEPRWTTHLSLVAPPASIAVWEAIPEHEREAAMVAAVERVLRTTAVLNDTLFFVKRYPRPALALACLAYFTSKEGVRKHGVKTMRAWVDLLRPVCAEKETLRPVLAKFPAK